MMAEIPLTYKGKTLGNITIIRDGNSCYAEINDIQIENICNEIWSEK